ncbi:MAG: bifunctional phosphoribosyl-AMP cyclohydrolase/phosphoribosyl-ATP diphosphatase HisIE [Bacteroidota bacterium]|nr:bifunctional phosphoribosyl-AMP cyclohydrolase/phosphoribosyl-ATP diphosphatase HisIE [Bacteroidota bacterium]
MTDFAKYSDGLIPAIIQDASTGKVLMLGFMNAEALDKTRKENRVTFFSRSKKRLWTKGEESGNFLDVKEILEDCDNDTLLIKAIPSGPVCHKGTDTCWGETNSGNFLFGMEQVIHSRKNADPQSSYTAELFSKGINKIAQKVGEEAIEVVIEAKDNNKDLFLNESADLLFHYVVLLAAKGCELKDVIQILEKRHVKK